jgi:release factor glutamine methyltransferase
MTVREALTRGAAFLRSTYSGNDTPALDAALLLGELLHRDRAALTVRDAEALSAETAAAFQALLERRAAGEPLAYITGRKEFRSLDFKVNPAVLIPRPDTETLVEAALEGVDSLAGSGGWRPITVLDLCTGTGAVAIALKHERPALAVSASDISPEALVLAKENAASLLPPAHGITFIESDLFQNIPGRFHLITANPPYVASDVIPGLAPEVRREPLLALDGGKDGLGIILPLITAAPRYLYPGGRLCLEADPRQMAAIAEILKAKGLGIRLYKDLAGLDRVISGVLPV